MEDVEFEHVIGCNGRIPNSLKFHSQSSNTIIYPSGCVVVIQDILNPHRQQYLRGHNEEVSALDVTRTGTLICTGQTAIPNSATKEAPVIIWDAKYQKPICEIKGLFEKVTHLCFSPDELYLAIADQTGCFFVYDIKNKQNIFTERLSNPLTMLAWADVKYGGAARPEYTIVFAHSAHVYVATMIYNIGSLRFNLDVEQCSLPPSGLVRQYNCCVIFGDVIAAGTNSGEIAFFKWSEKNFKSLMQLCSAGVHSLSISGDGMFVGGGNGQIKKIRMGGDWELLEQYDLHGSVTSLAHQTDSNDSVCIAVTSQGFMNLIKPNGDVSIVVESHTGPITDVSSSCDRPDTILTCSEDNSVRVWDLSTYKPVVRCFGPCGATSGIMNREGTVIFSGWADGYIRMFDAKTGKEIWNQLAHRGDITSVATTGGFLVTGGKDGKVNVWNIDERQLMYQFADHLGPVTQVLVDIRDPSIIVSTGLDRSIHFYNIQRGGHFKTFQMDKSTVNGFAGMCQKPSEDCEFITVGKDGNIILWNSAISVKPVEILKDVDVHSLTTVCSSPCGRFVVACGVDSQLKVYDLQSRDHANACRLLCRGLMHSRAIRSVQWTNDRKQIVAGGVDGLLSVWNYFEASPDEF
eukprot:TRINITY_DN2711_c0_g1_i1.p1 TRINITY_DN2711_c0_g1~~TRINITY_DN2711_c0_g1_i1.p1  ORF type:complete len:631 (+),score=133.59 TRINITY_DN2711_c0_g1_i1:43-1935(+)